MPVTLAARIEELLADKIATDGDPSMLARALGGHTEYTPDDLAFRRVEVLLAAWEEMHREAALRVKLDEILEEGAEDHAAMLAAQRGDPCANCGQGIGVHVLEDGFGWVCPTDVAARTDSERFTYTRPGALA